jgi:hydrogenase nickel incorporation protein HypA/HybF
MHELGIAQGIMERMEKVAREQDAAVVRVGVRIGELACVDPDSLTFGFEVLTKDTQFEGVKLEIDWRKRRQRCTMCEKEFEAETIFTACTVCGSPHTVTIGGDELDIAYIEVEDAICA